MRLIATGLQAAARLQADQVKARCTSVSGALLLVLGVIRLVSFLAWLPLKSPHPRESDTAMSTVLPQRSSKREEVASGRGTGWADRGASVRHSGKPGGSPCSHGKSSPGSPARSAVEASDVESLIH